MAGPASTPNSVLTVSMPKKPIPAPRRFTIANLPNTETPVCSAPFYPLFLQTSDFMQVDGYNGGHRGSAQDKKRYFEMIANKQLFQQQSHTDQLLQQKIQMGGSLWPSSDQTTVISGYDSVGGDFAAHNRSATATEASKQSPASCNLTEDEWSHEKAPARSQPEDHLQVMPVDGLYAANYAPINFAPSQPIEKGSNLDGVRHRAATPHAIEQMAPPAPPPPPPSNVINKWSVKTEEANEAPAEGCVEVPQRQSVASLREQIANKLEVKTPSGAKPMTAVLHNARQRHRSCITPLLSTEKTAPYSQYVENPIMVSSPSPGEFPSPVGKQNLRSSSESSYQVHEPVMRHLSCITPLPFSKPTIAHSPSLRSAPIQPLAPERSDGYANSCDSSCSNVNGFHAGEFDQRLYNDKLSDFSKTVKTDTKLSDSDSVTHLAQPTKSTPLPSDDPDEKPKLVNGYSVDCMLASPSSASVGSTQPEMPAFSVPYEMQSEQAAQLERSPASKAASGRTINASAHDHSLNRSLGAPLKEDQLGAHANMDTSDASHWYRNMFKKMHRIEERDQSVLKYHMRGFASPTPSHHAHRAWTPVLLSDSRPESRMEYECMPRRSKSVGRYVDSSANNDEDIVERWREERARLSTKGSSSASAHFGQPSSHKNDRSQEDRTTSRDLLELKKLSKEEIINRQKVEKLSEELEEQRSRRHGYIPSASPALQKNFDRFNGLLNDFGHEERSVTPKRTIPATCTALFTFKAQNPRELSFNRGDVIRVHRAVDANWLEGERSGQTGIFPSSYVQVDEYLPCEQKRVVALFPFFARNRNELSLKKGETVSYRRSIDTNWMEGINNRGEIGIFPKSYVQEVRETEMSNFRVEFESRTPDRPKTPKVGLSLSREESPMPSKKASHGEEVQAWQKKHTEEGLSGPAHRVPRNAETYRALYPYKPENADELELRENDIVFVVEKCDDGWYIGTLLRTGEFGTFPGNYVERH